VSGSGEGPSDLFVDDPLVRETLEIEHRLRESGYSSLPHVLDLGGDFDFDGLSIEEIVAEARRLLVHQHAVELSGARILASIGEMAVKVAAFDAVLELYKHRTSPPPTPG
jgi:hypothetical protein